MRCRAGGAANALVLITCCTSVVAADPATVVPDETTDSGAGSAEVIEINAKAPSEAAPVSYRITRDELDLIAGTDDDVLRAAQALPGVARIPFSLGGLALRGTSPADTAVYLDGIEVPIAFHFGGLASVYPSDLLSDLTVTPGNFDASYGRAEGGIVTLTTREPRTDQWRASGSLDLLSASAVAEGPIGDGGITIAVRRSYIDAVLGPFVSSNTPLPSYYDAQVRASFGDPEGLGRITPMAFMAFDQIDDTSSEDIQLTSLFVRVAVPYLKRWKHLSLQIVPWAGTNQMSYASNHFNEKYELPAMFERPAYPAGLRATLTRDFKWGHLRGGLDSEGGYLSRGNVPIFPGDVETFPGVSWVDIAGWAEALVKLFDGRLAIKPGVRVDHYGLTDENVIDPRVNIDVSVSESVTLHGALGEYHQPPAPADLNPVLGNPELKSSHYDQASLGVDAQLPAGVMLGVTGFYELGYDLGFDNPLSPGTLSQVGVLGPILDLLVAKELGFPEQRANDGQGRSYGVELLLKRHVGRWFGMVGYTLAKSEQRYVNNGDVGFFGIYPPPAPIGEWFRFDLDQRHNLNVAGSVTLATWTLGARVQIASGNPYVPVAYFDQTPCNCYNAGTLPTFFQLDVRAERVWHRHWGDLHGYIDIQNVTDYANVEAREWVGNEFAPTGYYSNTYGLPILPFIGVKYVPR
jgi:hypothetical protein